LSKRVSFKLINHNDPSLTWSSKDKNISFDIDTRWQQQQQTNKQNFLTFSFSSVFFRRKKIQNLGFQQKVYFHGKTV
jgi:hypothetical protein